MGSPASLNFSSSSMSSISALLVSDSGQELLSTLPSDIASPSSSASPLAASTLSAFCEWYSAHVHGVLSAALCVLGICSNLVNAVVLTRRTMFGQASVLLTSIAIADCLMMSGYLPYALHFYVFSGLNPKAQHSFACIVFLVAQQSFAICMHTLSMTLTVAMAWFRWVVVAIGRRSPLARFCCSVRGTKHVVFVLVLLSIVATVPNTLMHTIEHASPDLPPNDAAASSSSSAAHASDAANTSAGNASAPDGRLGPAAAAGGSNGYWVAESALANTTLKQVNFVVYGVCGKIVGSVLLGLLSLLLILSLRQAQAAAARMRKRHRARRRQRISLILALVTLLFAITEAPQGVLLLLSSFSEDFYEHEYAQLGDLQDLLTLLNSVLNFALYVAMSRQFRSAFRELFACVWAERFANGRRLRTASTVVARRPSPSSSGRTSDPETLALARTGVKPAVQMARPPLPTFR